MEAWTRHQQRGIMWRKSPPYQQRKSRLFATCFTRCMTIDNRSASCLFRKSPRKPPLLHNFKEASWLRVTDAEARIDSRLPVAPPNDVISSSPFQGPLGVGKFGSESTQSNAELIEGVA